MDEMPIPIPAILTGMMFTMTCPVCRVCVDDTLPAEEQEDGSFVVARERQFDLCSHCGAFLDLGARLRLEDAA